MLFGVNILLCTSFPWRAELRMPIIILIFENGVQIAGILPFQYGSYTEQIKRLRPWFSQCHLEYNKARGMGSSIILPASGIKMDDSSLNSFISDILMDFESSPHLIFYLSLIINIG